MCGGFYSTAISVGFPLDLTCPLHIYSGLTESVTDVFPYITLAQRTQNCWLDLTTLPVSPNHSTLNQSLIFFFHIVITTGCNQFLTIYSVQISLHGFYHRRNSAGDLPHMHSTIHLLFADNFSAKTFHFVVLTKLSLSVDAESQSLGSDLM